MKTKYNYNINLIEKLQNDGLTIADIAKKFGWERVATLKWISRNYVKTVRVSYTPKEFKK